MHDPKRTHPAPETTKEPAETQPSGLRVDPLQVIVKNPGHETRLNQDFAENRDGNKRDAKGRLTDADGNLIDDNGNRLDTAQNRPTQNQPARHDAQGRLADSEGHLVDGKGNRV